MMPSLLLCVLLTLAAVTHVYPVLIPADPTQAVRLPICQQDCMWDSVHSQLICNSARCSSIPQQSSDLAGLEPMDLMMRANNLTTIPALSLPSVTTLDVSENRITNISLYAFQDMPALVDLWLCDNHLSGLTTATFFGLHRLRSLELDGNRIHSLGPDVFYAYLRGTLIHLSLERNGLTDLDHNALTDLSQLSYLSLKDNNLSALLPVHLAGLRSLQILLLSNNPLGRLQDSTFNALGNLQQLFLVNTQLKEIEPNTFLGLNAIQTLYLENNQLQDIQGVLLNMHTLKRVNVSRNPLSHIAPRTFPAGMQEIFISHCEQLQKIDSSSFLGLQNLTRVDICHNKRLGVIAANAFDSNVRLTSLNLTGNALSSLSMGMVVWKQLNDVKLSDNPWRCDCRLQWMTTSDFPSKLKDTFVCVHPSYLAGAHVTDLQASDFVCHNYITIHSRPALIMIALATVALVVTIVVMCWYWRRQLLPCCVASSVKYMALFSVNDGEDSSVTVWKDAEFVERSSIVRKKSEPTSDWIQSPYRVRHRSREPSPVQV